MTQGVDRVRVAAKNLLNCVSKYELEDGKLTLIVSVEQIVKAMMELKVAVNMRERRGLSAMSAKTKAKVVRLGGIAVQASGRGHRFTSEEARAAGKKGGVASGSARRLNFRNG